MITLLFILITLCISNITAFYNAGSFEHKCRRDIITNTCMMMNMIIPGQKLYNAAYSGNVEELKAVLLENKGNKAVLNYRNEERYGRTPLVIASYYNRIESVKLLLSTPGVDVNASSDFGASALHFAAHRGHLEVVQLLLAKGAKVNALATGGKWTGKTPLDVVTGMGMSGKPEISEAIKAKGGKPGK
jgi:hypothetical protein